MGASPISKPLWRSEAGNFAIPYTADGIPLPKWGSVDVWASAYATRVAVTTTDKRSCPTPPSQYASDESCIACSDSFACESFNVCWESCDNARTSYDGWSTTVHDRYWPWTRAPRWYAWDVADAANTLRSSTFARYYV